jgi:hypothetical protein
VNGAWQRFAAVAAVAALAGANSAANNAKKKFK